MEEADHMYIFCTFLCCKYSCKLLQFMLEFILQLLIQMSVIKSRLSKQFKKCLQESERTVSRPLQRLALSDCGTSMYGYSSEKLFWVHSNELTISYARGSLAFNLNDCHSIGLAVSLNQQSMYTGYPNYILLT